MLLRAFDEQIKTYKAVSLSYSYEGKQLLHISAVKQLWLDCYLSSGVHLKQLSSPLKQKQWVDFDSFVQSVENLTAPKQRTFFKASKSANSKLEYRKQKWLFYFCMTAQNRKVLRKEKLGDVFSLSASQPLSKEQVRSLVSLLFDQLYHDCQNLTIDEFKRSISVN